MCIYIFVKICQTPFEVHILLKIKSQHVCLKTETMLENGSSKIEDWRMENKQKRNRLQDGQMARDGSLTWTYKGQRRGDSVS